MRGNCRRDVKIRAFHGLYLHDYLHINITFTTFLAWVYKYVRRWGNKYCLELRNISFFAYPPTNFIYEFAWAIRKILCQYFCHVHWRPSWISPFLLRSTRFFNYTCFMSLSLSCWSLAILNSSIFLPFDLIFCIQVHMFPSQIPHENHVHQRSSWISHLFLDWPKRVCLEIFMLLCFSCQKAAILDFFIFSSIVPKF